MAILFCQADGSEQHYDTYEEFEKAFVLIKRLNGEKVPQDLLDEVKAKYGDKETKPLQVKIDGNNFESAFRKAIRDVGEELDKLSKDRTPVSDECGVPEKAPKLEVGDKVRVISAEDGTDTPYHCHAVGSVGKVVSMQSNGGIEVDVDGEDQYLLPHHYEKLEPIGKDANGEEVEDSPTEFENDDLVRVTKSFRDSFGDVAKINSVLPVRIDGDGRVLGVGTVLIGDNLDKLRLVCRRENRKDIEL